MFSFDVCKLVVAVACCDVHVHMLLYMYTFIRAYSLIRKWNAVVICTHCNTTLQWCAFNCLFKRIYHVQERNGVV